MPLYHILILALVQGLSEFLPISSSGHLVLTHHLLGNTQIDLCWATNRLIDVAVHVGTLLSVLVYFHRDILNIIQNIFSPQSDNFKLGNNIIIASLPVVVIGFLIQKWQPEFLCFIEVMAWMTLIFGVILWIADRTESSKRLDKMNKTQALIIGLSQALALIPGVSRSGITMTSARFLGFSRIEAARFSLLLSIVAISGAGLLNGLTLLETGNYDLNWSIFWAVGLSFLSGWLAIILMMKWLARATFAPFAIYRIILGVVLLILIYTGIF